jgi:hypothetical protein
MEEWYHQVRIMREESDNGPLVKEFCYYIFQDLKLLKVKDKKKFAQRVGPDYEGWTEMLEEKYPKPMVREILHDDDFWKLTLKQSRGW